VPINCPVENERGERLLAIHGDSFSKGIQSVAPTFALAIVASSDGILLAFNRRRQLWELPGGMIERGESPTEAASRELFEETGQIAADLQLRCLIELEVPSRPVCGVPGIEIGAVFCGQLPHLQTFRENDEIDGISFWRPGAFTGKVSAIDEALLLATAMSTLAIAQPLR
jgi:8-oxo-dGTP diphosphatase